MIIRWVLLWLMLLSGCASTGRHVRVEGTCECRGTGTLYFEAGVPRHER